VVDAIGDAPCVESVQLAASELVSNVVRHAPYAGSVEVAIRATDGTVRIEVTQLGDDASGVDVAAEASWPRALELTGRGLRIVDAISTAWGVDDERTVTVWCEIPC
jgi:anti-sigma regulatory factor (Ser/Thr protein kinase)